MGQELPTGLGPLCLIYEETSIGLDGPEFTCYWLRPNHWILHHAPCLENLVAVIVLVRWLGIWVLGSDVPMALLQQLETGKKFIPEVAKHRRGRWHPEDLINPRQGRDMEWHKALWEGAQKHLERHRIGVTNLNLEQPATKNTEPVK